MGEGFPEEIQNKNREAEMKNLTFFILGALLVGGLMFAMPDWNTPVANLDVQAYSRRSILP